MDPRDVIDAEHAGENLEATFEAIGQARMPFGRFGPEQFPPNGVPIIDLPFEYLEWFARHGFPSGHFGRLLSFVYHTKLEGADEIFDPFRRQNGGRASLRRRTEPPRLDDQ